MADELQVRRVRWYQSWARHPQDHHAVVTDALGTCQAEEMVGVHRLSEEGKVCQTSTPLAKHMADDLHKVSKTSESVGAWFGQRRSDVAIFTPGAGKVRGFWNSLWKNCGEQNWLTVSQSQRMNKQRKAKGN